MGELYVKKGNEWVPVVSSGTQQGPQGPAGPQGPPGPPAQPGPFSGQVNGYCTLAPGIVMVWGRETIPSTRQAAESQGWVWGDNANRNAYKIVNFQNKFSTEPWNITMSLRLQTSPPSWFDTGHGPQCWLVTQNTMRIVHQHNAGGQNALNAILYWNAIGPG